MDRPLIGFAWNCQPGLIKMSLDRKEYHMRRTLGFTLIEVMITVVVIAILTAIAYPSYLDYIRRSQRAQGQQFLLDLAQRQEQYLLDNRAYATSIATVAAPGVLVMAVPVDVQAKYQAPTITVTAGPPPTYIIKMIPITGGSLAGDGTLYIDSTQQRWRSSNTSSTTYNNVSDCRWEETRCKPS
jgi:type IV pilus assembly protein PilE